MTNMHIDHLKMYNTLSVCLEGLYGLLERFIQHPVSASGDVSTLDFRIDNAFKTLRVFMKCTDVDDQFLSARHLYVFGRKLVEHHEVRSGQKVLREALSAVPMPQMAVKTPQTK